MKRFRIMPSLLVLLLIFASCSSSKTSPRDNVISETPSVPEIGMDMDTSANGMTESPGEASPPADMTYERKLVKTGEYYIETLEYNKTVDELEEMIEEMGGYIEAQNISGGGSTYDGYERPRHAIYTVKIPADKYGDFTSKLAEIGNVLNSNSTVNDITDQYYDIEARIKSLKIQESALLDILAKASKLDEVITLQTALSDVRYQIENNEGILRRMDKQVAYSTAQLDISEVYEGTQLKSAPKSLWDRIKNEFSDSLANILTGAQAFIVFFIGNIIYILFFAAAAFIAIRFILKNKRDKRQ